MAIKPHGTMRMLSRYKRVLRRYEAVEPRKFVWVSMHTDSMSVALVKAGLAWDKMVDGWEAKLAGETSDACGAPLMHERADGIDPDNTADLSAGQLCRTGFNAMGGPNYANRILLQPVNDRAAPASCPNDPPCFVRPVCGDRAWLRRLRHRV